MNTIDVIFFGGQSNMQGQTECLTNTDVIEGAYEYRFLENAIKPLCNPVGENVLKDGSEGYVARRSHEERLEWIADHALGTSVEGHTNLVPEFCRAYRAACGREILAVHTAKGSTKIAEWLKGTDGYRVLLAKSQGALQKIREEYRVERIFFVWLQGESDAISGNSRAYYKEKIVELKNSLAEDLGIQRFGIIRVGRFTGDERDWEIIEAQDEICREDPDFLMLTRITTELNEIPEYMNPYAKGHYSARGLERLGEAAGGALGAWRAETT